MMRKAEPQENPDIPDFHLCDNDDTVVATCKWCKQTICKFRGQDWYHVHGRPPLEPCNR